jgi:hypothetical protein
VRCWLSSIPRLELRTRVLIPRFLSAKLSVVKGKVENIDLPEKVDVIVSEWMVSLCSLSLASQPNT